MDINRLLGNRPFDTGNLEFDLLLFHPNKKPVLIFSPTEDSSPKEREKIGNSFFLKLKSQLGYWKNEWSGRGVDREILPDFIKEMWHIK